MPTIYNLKGVDLEIEPIKNLIAENGKIFALKQVIDRTNCGLVVAKNFVESIDDLDNFDPNNTSIPSNKEGVSSTNRNGKITVTYINGKIKKKVTPLDPEWQRVKALMSNNDLIAQYERQFAEGKTGKNQTLIQKNEGFSNTKKVLTAVIILVLIIIYLEFF